MKLIRFGERGNESPSLLLSDGTRVDVSAEWNGLRRRILWRRQHRKIATLGGEERCERAPNRLLGPSRAASEPSQQNRLHRTELPGSRDRNPPGHTKGTRDSLVGPNDAVTIPQGANKLGWEVELGVVIGKTARYVSKNKALEHVAGYALHNDYSERGSQIERGGQWVKGKSADTFAPLGPFRATRDEIPDPGRLSPAAESKWGDSAEEWLLPGDGISTGTPAGVGPGMNPPSYLKPGDVLELGTQGLGQSRQEVMAYKE